METRFLDVTDQQQISSFCRFWLNRFSRPTQSHLYHYTDSSGLIGILQSKMLRASNIAYLNDAMEYKHVADIAQARIHDKMSDCCSQFSKLLLKGAYHELLLGQADVPNVFVSCLSEERDCLSQWRGYGGPHAGFAIRFDVQELMRSLENTGIHLLPCNYDEALHKEFVDEALQMSLTVTQARFEKLGLSSEEDVRAYIKDVLSYIFWNLDWFAPALKHSSFAQENEWRLLRRGAEVGDIEFLAKPTMVSGYVPVQCRRADGLLPISEVMVGPSKNADLSAFAIKALLQKLGYKDVPVTRSRSPYRAV
ncbi:MAG: DUF2971 domain-containing protein [Rhodospirillaceae bacterium]|nr:DUF2971 domain-containing protein [Rhodospirillales bacterium]